MYTHIFPKLSVFPSFPHFTLFFSRRNIINFVSLFCNTISVSPASAASFFLILCSFLHLRFWKLWMVWYPDTFTTWIFWYNLFPCTFSMCTLGCWWFLFFQGELSSSHPSFLAHTTYNVTVVNSDETVRCITCVHVLIK